MNARLSGIPALHVAVTESEAARIVECETERRNGSIGRSVRFKSAEQTTLALQIHEQ